LARDVNQRPRRDFGRFQHRDGQDIQLLPSLRYAHSETYIGRLAGAARFTGVRITEAPIRHDRATPIMSLYVYLE